MKLLEATQIAVELVNKLRPYCDRIEVAGSIRRGRREVHDIDIVAILNEDKITAAGYFGRQHLIGTIANTSQPIRSGQSIASFVFKDINVDIYWATHSTWGTLLLIRTGSKQHNIKLATLASSSAGIISAVTAESLAISSGTVWRNIRIGESNAEPAITEPRRELLILERAKSSGASCGHYMPSPSRRDANSMPTAAIAGRFSMMIAN
jgi:hypothetical protein